MQLASIMKSRMETIPKYFQDIHVYCKTASFLRYEHDYVVLITEQNLVNAA